MDKEELYQQIQAFNNQLTNPSDKSSKTYEKAYLYVDDKNAEDKARFIGYLIYKDYMQYRYSTILDLTFGSGNLTSHIIFDNYIEYEKLFLNDIKQDKTNQDIIRYLNNSRILSQDILDKEKFKYNNYDLVIINPQIGGNYIDGDILRQKDEDENQLDILIKLSETLNYLIEHGSTVLFYGEEKHFKSIFTNSSYIKYNSILTDIFIVSNELKESLCFEKDGNSFVECTNDTEADEEIESFDNIEIDAYDNEEYQDVKVESVVMQTEETKENFTNEVLGKLGFLHKNLLLKGVPGTGKSKTIDNIIENDLDMNDIRDNVLRINIHSASSNSDLMQGISISTDDKSNILYQEKRGAVLKHIFKAMFKPNQPFVLVLEEIQENSLNELIGDLIYLIEKDKRTEIKLENDQELSYEELFEKVKPKHFVELPNLVEGSESNIKMIMPDNLYVFCTSNYRDDKKVIEDNLLRRFDVVEIYPQTQEELGEEIFKSKEVSDFLSKLNELIEEQFKDETHPDRYLVGHANWLSITDKENEDNKKLFYTALLKVLVEFKEIREVDFETYVRPILEELVKESEHLSDQLKQYIDECNFEYKSYKEMVEKLQKKIYSFVN